jgi:hypothetical protein
VGTGQEAFGGPLGRQRQVAQYKKEFGRKHWLVESRTSCCTQENMTFF